jgi:uncharacterized protein YggE
MRKGLLLGLVIGVILAGAVSVVALAGSDPSAPATAYSSGAGSEQSAIWVSGAGEVTVIPDIAVLSLGVESEEATVQEAMDEAAVVMDRVMSTLLDKGIVEKDIQTQWFNVYPVRKWTEWDDTIIGYEVTNTVTVKIRDVDATGQIIDAVAKAGGDLIRIQGVSFTVDDPSSYYAEARAEAVADATAKAKQLADLSGVQLGKPFYISEGGGYTSNPIYRDYEMMSFEGGSIPTTSISPGETQITLTVQMAFNIQ